MKRGLTDDTTVGLVVYLAKRLLQTDQNQPYLFDDRLNDLSVAVWEYERVYGRILTDLGDLPLVEQKGSVR